MVNSSPPVYSNGVNGIKTAHLKLYAPCAAGIKYLLAQSPDTEHLVPDVQEAEWEVVGTKKDVKVVYRNLPFIEIESPYPHRRSLALGDPKSTIPALCDLQIGSVVSSGLIAEPRHPSDSLRNNGEELAPFFCLDKQAYEHQLARHSMTGWCLQLYKEVAKPPEKLNKTRGIGIIKAPTDFVASVIADDYEAWDDTIKELRVLKSERDPDTGALVEIIWTRYCLRERSVVSCAKRAHHLE